jgi:hypothetical protein
MMQLRSDGDRAVRRSLRRRRDGDDHERKSALCAWANEGSSTWPCRVANNKRGEERKMIAGRDGEKTAIGTGIGKEGCRGEGLGRRRCAWQGRERWHGMAGKR